MERNGLLFSAYALIQMPSNQDLLAANFYLKDFTDLVARTWAHAWMDSGGATGQGAIRKRKESLPLLIIIKSPTERHLLWPSTSLYIYDNPDKLSIIFVPFCE